MKDAYMLSLPGAALQLIPRLLPDEEAAKLTQRLLASLAWEHRQIQLFGRWVDQPRLTAWYADPGLSYRYSGTDWHPTPWTPDLQVIKQAVENRLGVAFNSCLANLYRDGHDSMGWHADDETSLGPEPVIASVSLGAERDFALRRRDDHTIKHTIPLPHNSLLVMAGQTQHAWHHALPKRKRVTQPRINLTFRRVRTTG